MRHEKISLLFTNTSFHYLSYYYVSIIDKIYLSNFISTLYFILNLLYSIIIILTILSKKEIFKTTISYNILNIGIYLYTILLFKNYFNKYHS